MIHQSDSEYSEVDDYKRDSAMNTRDYFSKMEYDMDPTDMCLNERKLRKFYNLVQRKKYPVGKLSKDT